MMTSHISNTGRRHQMETLSALLTLCEGNLLVTGGFPSQKPVTPNFDDFSHLRLNNQMQTIETKCPAISQPVENMNAFCALNIDVIKTKFGQKLQHSLLHQLKST